MDPDILLRKQLAELLEGGFAKNIPLFREFDYEKAGIILDGLHFSDLKYFHWWFFGNPHLKIRII